MKEINTKRTLATQPFSFNAYEESYEDVMAICEASGRKLAEELRDLLEEGIRSRKRQDENDNGEVSPNVDQLTHSSEEASQLIDALQQLAQKTSAQTEMIMQVAISLREQYGLVLESVAAGYSARHLIWKYIVERMLREEGLTPSHIKQRLDEERRTWNAERDRAADVLEAAIKSLRPGS
ncbi:MAG TPA: hypothetical protein VLR90_13790 [Blastocatellia bacterium]|nr:hypothetical protein [Blastocatellia bacterium]